jgi:hypothetical protein
MEEYKYYVEIHSNQIFSSYIKTKIINMILEKESIENRYYYYSFNF